MAVPSAARTERQTHTAMMRELCLLSRGWPAADDPRAPELPDRHRRIVPLSVRLARAFDPSGCLRRVNHTRACVATDFFNSLLGVIEPRISESCASK